jgi:hypothetical protein
MSSDASPGASGVRDFPRTLGLRTSERNRANANRKEHATNIKAKEKKKMTAERPSQEIRLGRIKASIWRNQTATGTRFNVTVCRLYRDGEQWKISESFGRDDLPLVCKALDQAHTWILAAGNSNRNEPNEEAFSGALEESA